MALVGRIALQFYQRFLVLQLGGLIFSKHVMCNCGVFVIPPVGPWARVCLFWVRSHVSYVISFCVRHVLLVELLKVST